MVRAPQCSCPNAQSLFTLLGKKWIIFIMYAIENGACTFTDIRKSIGDANTKILTDRLAELVCAGIIEKNIHGEKYSLSPLGKELSYHLVELSHWWGMTLEKQKK